MECNICGNNSLEVVYEGPIRHGGDNSVFVEGYSVLSCGKCCANVLSPVPENINDFYESEEYRQTYFKTINEVELAKKSDWDQNDRIAKIGVENVRGKVIADFGSGLGFFLDCVKGLAKSTVAVEPMRISKKILEKKGHKYFEYPSTLPPESIDVGVSFDVLEHIEKPVPFLQSIYKSLKDEAFFYIAVPNNNDILMNFHSGVYQRFFYCTAHLYYYSIDSLSYVLEKSGFTVLERGGFHKYDFFNFTNWLQKGLPGGRQPTDFIDQSFESTFKNELIRLGLGSHVFIKAQK